METAGGTGPVAVMWNVPLTGPLSGESADRRRFEHRPVGWQYRAGPAVFASPTLEVSDLGRLWVSDELRQPIDVVLPGQQLHPLDEGWTPLATLALIKCLDEDGDVVWAFRTTEQFNLEELLGAMTVQTEGVEGEARQSLARL